MEMMPDQMAMQSAMMRPMMFTMIFIIAIFSWMANSVAEFRVDYVSVPWQPMWNMNGVIMWIFPAWVKHYVAPFYSDVTRISVAGNITDTVPLASIKPGIPIYPDKK